jgi:tape measure domain-containing protein
MAQRTDKAQLIIEIVTNGNFKMESTLAGLRRQARDLQRALNNLEPNTEPFNALAAQLRAVNQQMTGITSQFREARNESTQTFGTMLNFVARLAVAYYALKSAFQAVFKPSQLASEFEQAQIAFETMLGSAEKARKLTAQVIKLAATSPFEQSELIDYTKRLLAMGIESNKVIATMKSLGDIAAGVGKDKLPQIVLAFGQVATKTKLAGGELKQFSEAGVPLVAALAKQFGVAEGAILKMTEKGQIKFKDVEKAIQSLTTEGGKFANLMGKQAQITEGLLSTLKDNTNLALAAFGDGFNEAFKEILKSANAFSSGLDREKIRDFGKAVGEAIKFLFEFGPALLKVVSIYGIYRIATAAIVTETGLATAAQVVFRAANIATSGIMALLSGNLTRAAAAMRLFTLATAVNPLGLLIAGVSAAVILLQSLKSKTVEVSDAQKELNRTAESETKIIQKLQGEMSVHFEMLKSGNITQDERRRLIGEINSKYGEYLPNLLSEKDSLEKINVAQAAANNLIEQKILLIAYEKEVAKVYQKSAEAAESAYTQQKGIAQTQKTLTENKFDNGRYNEALKNQTNLLQVVRDGNIAIVKDTPNQLNEIQKNFEPLAAALGSSIDKIKAKFAAKPDAIKKEGVDPTSAADAKKALDEELKRIQAATQYKVNVIMLENLRLGKIEKDYEDDILKAKQEGFGNELTFYRKHKNVYVGEVEKTEADILKITRERVEKSQKRDLDTQEQNFKQSQVTLDVQRARSEITEAEYKQKTLENNAQFLTQKAELLITQGKRETDEYAKVLLERSHVEKEISETTLRESLDIVKNKITTLLQAEELRYEKGEISEHTYKRNILQIQIQGVQEELAILEAKGETESEIYRALNLKKLQLKKQGQQAEIDVLLDGVSKMTLAEQQALSEALAEKRITQHEFDLAMLKDKERVLQNGLELLRKNGLENTEVFRKMQEDLTGIQGAQSKSRADIAAEEARKTQQFFGELGESFQAYLTDQISTEIELLSSSEEDKKKNAFKIKNLRKQQVDIDTYASVAKIWFHAMDFGIPLGPILAGVQTAFAFAQGENLKSKIDAAKFEKGGMVQVLGGKSHANGGTKGVFDDGTVVEMEAGEALAVVNKKNTPLLRALSNINAMHGNGTPFFEGGGLVLPNTTPNPSVIFTPQYYVQNNAATPGPSQNTSSEVLKAMIAKFDEVITAVKETREVKLYRDKLEDATANDETDRNLAAWKI